MSATIGMCICFFISFIAFASSISRHATLIISHPAFSKFNICFTVASMSFVFVLHIDCMTTLFCPPIWTFPTIIFLVFSLFIFYPFPFLFVFFCIFSLLFNHIFQQISTKNQN